MTQGSAVRQCNCIKFYNHNVLLVILGEDWTSKISSLICCPFEGDDSVVVYSLFVAPIVCTCTVDSKIDENRCKQKI